MLENNFKILYNSNLVKDIVSFININNSIKNNNSRQICFTVIAGVNATYTEDIGNMDRQLNNKMNSGQILYIRIKELVRQMTFEDTAFYSDAYDKWSRSRKLTLKCITDNIMTERAGNALQRTLTVFRQTKTVSPSMEKNFAVKLLFWYDNLFKPYISQFQPNIPLKIVTQNIIKIQEYLFFYMLTQSGCNVLLLQSEKAIDTVAEKLKLSYQSVIGNYSNIKIPEYTLSDSKDRQKPVVQKSTTNRNTVSIPPRTDRRQNIVSQSPNQESKPKIPQRTEKSFEELAQLAKSVVMIAVHDRKGDIIGLGSGIMIGKEGYILTNNHVARGGAYYSVHIENDDNTYMTDEVIKYHPLYDLAVIRIEKRLDPIPVYKGQKELVRGQKVVAIGSPLGLFNSVSDGIISGFREVKDGVVMIQFTAPISSGSSGGAVLNLYGEVIGISTAGIVEGQNINLAMDYKYINQFIKGFV